MSFATDTMVERVGERCFRAELAERWMSLVAIHGGYSAAIVSRAIEAAVDDPKRALRTLAVQFASAPRPGPVEIEVMVERSGRSMTTTSARLLQGRRVMLVAHAVSSPARAGPRTTTSYAAAAPTRAPLRSSGLRARSSTSGTPRSGWTPMWFRSAEVTSRTLLPGYDRSKAKRSMRPGSSPCATSSPPRCSRARPDR